jgi:N-acetylmuramoyl-L-alanine amidase
MRLVISSGHGKYVRGASGYIDEVDEARKVVEEVARLARSGATVTTYHDDVSQSQNENLNRIVDFHNSQTRDLDVSVHFNAYQTTTKPMGCEVLYVSDPGLAEAEPLVNDICAASKLINRGAKLRSDLFFLNNTEEPAILIETCFVDSKADVDIYHSKFNEICEAIAKNLVGDTDESLPPPQPVGGEETIKKIASNSAIAKYNWRDRGIAPPGYTKGFALAWAQVYQRYLIGDAVALEMAKANTHNDDKDVLAWYNSNFAALGMSNDVEGMDTLRHLFALLMGLGMRESSGRHCEGRDQSASNVTSDTAEAGLYQTSYNAHTCTPRFDEVMSAYGNHVHKGYLDVFREGVYCNSSSWASYGSGKGRTFQDMCKEQPAFAVETCALTLRNLRQHYGPINRKEAELRHEADDMLHAVQHQVESMV